MSVACDLVLLSWNHLEQTQPCLETLFATTRTPCRLFIVDNGSEEPVRRFLAGVKPAGAIREVVLLQNEKNEGFPRGMNRGIQASSAPYVCLLNNDLRFTPGWLEELLAVAEANPQIGVLNPESNTFGKVPPRGMPIDRFAETLGSLRGQYTEVGMCIGFCMLIARPAVERLGGLTDEVERIFFEDEDYAMRAQAAGFVCAVASASYVFHAEHQTVRQMAEREAIFQRNRRWCEGKWGRRLRIAWPRFETPPAGSPELKAWLERLIGWARRRNLVYVYAPIPQGLSGPELFRSVGLAPHVDVQWYRIPRAAAQVAAAGLILKRVKKPFDLIATPNGLWGAAIRRLGFWHRADVVPVDDEQRLTEAWTRKSRSLS